jgi:predicted GNAT family acetyltransferase
MEVIHDNKSKKFYIGKDKIIAEMLYINSGKKIIIEHTWVDDEHRSEGLGKVLMDGMAEFARKAGIKVTPHCPYAKKMFTNHPDLYGDILSSQSE